MPRRHMLDGGTLLLTDRIPRSKSVSLGFWVALGSRDEGEAERGFAHFIEHMLFKGTAGRSCGDIAREIDGMGGEINGATGKETTDYYVNVPSAHLSGALELLADMFFHSSLERSEFEKERRVILDEIDLTTDDPEEQVSDLFSAKLWGAHPLGRTATGEKHEVDSVRLQSLKEFYRRCYKPSRLVVSAAGGIEEVELIRVIEPLLHREAAKDPDSGPVHRRENPVPKIGKECLLRDLEQVYVTFGREGYSFSDETRHAGALLNIIVGNSFSSRLFQRIREQAALCYSIGSSLLSYSDGGEFSISFSTSPGNLERVLAALERELRLVKIGDLTEQELQNAKNRFKGNYILSQESNEWKMARMAVHEIVFGRIIPFDETLRKIEEVTLDELNLCAARLLEGKRFSSACAGPEGAGSILREWQFTF
jgi:predicted Zn-dependent peptidase